MLTLSADSPTDRTMPLLRVLTAVLPTSLPCGAAHAQDCPRPGAEVAPQIAEADERVE
jgi:hypothetical protein